MKLVYAVAFKKIKPLRECKNCKSDHLEMEIIGECALDKSMEGPGKTSKKNLEDNLWGHILWILQTIGCCVSKIFSIKMQTRVQFLSSYPVNVKKTIQQIGIEYRFSSYWSN